MADDATRAEQGGWLYWVVAQFVIPSVVDAYMDVGGTIPGMESVESSRDAYMDVGGRKRPEQVFERRPRKRLEQVFEGS